MPALRFEPPFDSHKNQMNTSKNNRKHDHIFRGNQTMNFTLLSEVWIEIGIVHPKYNKTQYSTQHADTCKKRKRVIALKKLAIH